MLFYIDPGTGSMLFTILIAILGSLIYFSRCTQVLRNPTPRYRCCGLPNISKN